jgi:hypothetical protein
VLLDRNPTDTWYNVIDVETSTEGWISADLIKIKYTANKRTEPLFEARSTGGYSNPTLEITNDSAKTLYLKLAEIRYTILPSSSKTITLNPGIYKYYASAPGVIPDYGEEQLNRGMIYTWRFYIVTTTR